MYNSFAEACTGTDGCGAARIPLNVVPGSERKISGGADTLEWGPRLNHKREREVAARVPSHGVPGARTRSVKSKASSGIRQVSAQPRGL